MIKLLDIKPLPLLENGIAPTSMIYGTSVFFERGKNYLVKAASGKGKSTFLHIMYGLRNDFEGEVMIEEKNIKNMLMNDWADVRQKKMSIVFQDLRLFLSLTAWENIILKRDLTDTPSVNDAKMMAEALGVTAVLNQKAETLSYGQRQRIAIIRALCQPFEILFLDEPFSNLDVENIKIATQLIKETCKKNQAGLVLVSLGEEYFFDYDAVLMMA